MAHATASSTSLLSPKLGIFPVLLLLMDNLLLIRVQGLYLTCASSATRQKVTDEKHSARHSVFLQIYYMIAHQMGRMALQIDFE